MGDLISRQAAMVVFRCSGLDDDSKDTVVRVLEQLPSAQPEIIRCKDCKKNPHWEWVGCPMTGKNTRKPDDFCSYAERRTDDSISD